jgi:hypothetical protein
MKIDIESKTNAGLLEAHPRKNEMRRIACHQCEIYVQAM